MADIEEKNTNECNINHQISTNNEEHQYWDEELDADILAFCDNVEKEELMKRKTEEKKTQGEPDNRTEEDLQTPLQRFRPGYLWVSDLTKQNWCEQQLYYSFTLPGIIVEDKHSMKEGSSLHLARGVFFVGLIDELRFDPELYTVTLSELKTKTYKSPPSKAQKSQHKLQVMLYKKLFDDLVKGELRKESVAKHLRVDLSREFGDDVTKELEKHLIDLKNLNQLLDYLFQKFQALTCINQMQIEYVHQESKETLCHSSVDYDDTELESLLDHYFKFWRGEREILGVDIEDAWKCGKCDFSDMCVWREKKSQECSNSNKLKRK